MFTRLARVSMYTLGAYVWAHMPRPMMHCISLACGNYVEDSSSIASFVMRNCDLRYLLYRVKHFTFSHVDKWMHNHFFFCLYLNNVVMFSSNLGEHVGEVRRVLQHLLENKSVSFVTGQIYQCPFLKVTAAESCVRAAASWKIKLVMQEAQRVSVDAA